MDIIKLVAGKAVREPQPRTTEKAGGVDRARERFPEEPSHRWSACEREGKGDPSNSDLGFQLVKSQGGNALRLVGVISQGRNR